MLTCKEAEKMVMPYMDDKLTDDELEAFLKHIHDCPACREELEIYYTVTQGLRQLDEESDAYDITGALEESIDLSWLHVHTSKLRRVVRYAVDTLGITGVLTILLMQLRMWMQHGIF